MDDNNKRNIFIAGHNGMVGSAIHRLLHQQQTANVFTANRAELDLLDTDAVKLFLQKHKVDTIYMAAARVGGIHANNAFPAEFIQENLQIQLAVVDAAFKSGIKKMLFLGSSCIYPRMAAQPIAENALMSGKLEPTNEPYAIAKIAGIKLCESYNRQYGTDYRSVMPTDLYGINDNFHPENSHVVPALMRRFHEAKVNNLPNVVVWGSGKPMREFLYVDDMAEACIHIMNIDKERFSTITTPMESHINIGTGLDCTIAELTNTMAKVVGYDGKIVWDSQKPDGTPRKLLNVDRAASLGWKSSTSLEEGLSKTYEWFTKDSLNGNIRGV